MSVFCSVSRVKWCNYVQTEVRDESRFLCKKNPIINVKFRVISQYMGILKNTGGLANECYSACFWIPCLLQLSDRFQKVDQGILIHKLSPYIYWNDLKMHRIPHLFFFFFQIKYLFYYNMHFLINLCIKPISMVLMKVKISFDISRKGHNSSLPNMLVLRIQMHRFPRLHLQ